MPSSRVQRKQSVVQKTDNNNGGGMKKQGGPVTTGITHTYWHPTLTRTIIKGQSLGNNGVSVAATTFGPVTFTGNFQSHFLTRCCNSYLAENKEQKITYLSVFMII